MTADTIESAIEGLLFASGDPLEISRIAAVLGISENAVISAADTLSETLLRNRRGVRVIRIERALQMCSAPEHSDIIRIAMEKGKPPRLSSQALETLSVVAYFQPVTRSYIEQVRGVDCTNTLHVLMTRGFIERHGHLSIPGRPSLYRTTEEFLRTFGLQSLEELPPLPGVGEPDAQIRLADFTAD